ncbi:MAG TPA: hypothetical protein VHU87_09680 [Rhizomicrobium sp.]|nr:hypothetical protein [Rhizomicrobium sp.]
MDRTVRVAKRLSSPGFRHALRKSLLLLGFSTRNDAGRRAYVPPAVTIVMPFAPAITVL